MEIPDLDAKNEAMGYLWIIERTQGITSFFGDFDLVMHLNLAHMNKAMVNEFYR